MTRPSFFILAALAALLVAPAARAQTLVLQSGDNVTVSGAGAVGTIGGTHLDGDILNTTFSNNGTINFNLGTPPAAAPEPSAFVALVVGALGLGALTVQARRRPA